METYNEAADREFSEKLEALIDAHGLYNVVETLSTICSEKAEHIETNWQDGKLARQWDYAAKSLYRCGVESAVHSL